MYNYELKNNHYIITIQNRKFLLDTGSPNSYVFFGDREVEIDENRYSLLPKPMEVDLAKVNELVGTHVDGFIGLDIVKATNVTIYKNGLIDFSARSEQGEIVPLVEHPLFILFKAQVNESVGNYLVDTGARYGYATPNVFNNLKPYNGVSDYNPGLGDLYSDIYHVPVTPINKVIRTVDLCNNDMVTNYRISRLRYSVIAIANITDLFDEVCVIDVRNNRMIIR